MKDSGQMTQQIEEALARVNPVPAEEPGCGASSAQAQALLRRILGSLPDEGRDHTAGTRIPRRRLPARKAWAGLGACAAAGAVAVTAITISAQGHGQTPGHPGPQPHAVARSNPAHLPAHLVDFTRSDGSLVVKITDPDAPVSQLNAIFKAHGLHIKINVIPVPRELVGTIIYSDVPATRELQAGSCQMNESGRCWIGFILPPGFTGSGNLTIGRPARPGEHYQSGVGPPTLAHVPDNVQP
jgi:phosphatidylethanolamine-binding protein (PEBP) family uncharacterized protein